MFNMQKKLSGEYISLIYVFWAKIKENANDLSFGSRVVWLKMRLSVAVVEQTRY